MSQYDPKQVIVMRKDLNMRKGKMIAQGAHASIAFLTTRMRDNRSLIKRDLSEIQWWWIDGSFTKICVGVNSQEELLTIHEQARNLDIEAHLIQDSGLTEFDGIPTYTCLALGPDVPQKIDELTGHLSLL